ncbi:hypothetical protein AYO21_11511 [Fonsecaea monophora]|uniref:Uncharacterized protein n=1 Tax=Fonsecaea monophora TaxID=254056 RepID=A0A177ES94_9EURO|nr:hypothetical protein AYO21_11511 [Fonsecaea monophora]OAG34331.1 hypothetical protein AYO21_11511 [Fonsecaea monophora]
MKVMHTQEILETFDPMFPREASSIWFSCTGAKEEREIATPLDTRAFINSAYTMDLDSPDWVMPTNTETPIQEAQPPPSNRISRIDRQLSQLYSLIRRARFHRVNSLPNVYADNLRLRISAACVPAALKGNTDGREFWPPPAPLYSESPWVDNIQ